MADARHRSRRRARPARRIILLAAGVLLAGAGTVGALLLLRDDPPAEGCIGSVTLDVVVSPALVSAVNQAAIEYQDQLPAAGGRCVAVSVTAAEGHEVAEDIRENWTDLNAGSRPDVWIPDSTTWMRLARLSEPGRRQLPETGTVIATSPVVIAMPEARAAVLGWPDRQLSWADLLRHQGQEGFWADRGKPEWGGFTVGFADPRASAAGLTALMKVVAATLGTPISALTEEMFLTDLATKAAVFDFERAAVVTGSDSELLAAAVGAPGGGQPGGSAPAGAISAFPLPESVVYQCNHGLQPACVAGGGAGLPLTASYPIDGLVVEEIPYAVLTPTAEDPLLAEAAAGFLDVLRSAAGQQALTEAGFRGPDRSNPVFAREDGVLAELRNEPRQDAATTVLTAAQATFAGVHQPANTLVVLDTSGSMNEEVPDSGGQTRLQVALHAVRTAVTLYADESHLGLWHFSVGLDGDRDYRELVPLGPMDEPVDGLPRTQALAEAAAAIQPVGATGLYDTTLAAFRLMTEHYLPDRLNQVVLLTDGRNEDPVGIGLDELVTTLRQEYSSQRPVQVITIGYGVDADPDALRRISAATGAKSYSALDPNKIEEVLVDALSALPDQR